LIRVFFFCQFYLNWECMCKFSLSGVWRIPTATRPVVVHQVPCHRAIRHGRLQRHLFHIIPAAERRLEYHFRSDLSLGWYASPFLFDFVCSVLHCFYSVGSITLRSLSGHSSKHSQALLDQLSSVAFRSYGRLLAAYLQDALHDNPKRGHGGRYEASFICFPMSYL
jgi:hypothetical protein